MGFQSTVFFQQGLGVPGDRYADFPSIARSFDIVSALASYNIIGATMFTITSQGLAQAGNTGSSGVFAGLLVNPHVYTTAGVGGVALAPTLTLPNNSQVELATEGSFVVTLPAAANIGDLVVFDNVTGAMSTIIPSAALPVGKTFGYAMVDFFTVTAAGLGVITLNPTLRIPT